MTELMKNETVEDAVIEKEPTLADKVKGVENMVVKAMLDAALPIMEDNGYSGFKNVSLLTSQPDDDGNVRQSLQVIL